MTLLYEMLWKSNLNNLFVNKTEPRLFSLKSSDSLGRLGFIKPPGIIMIKMPSAAVRLAQKILVHSHSPKAVSPRALRKQDHFR